MERMEGGECVNVAHKGIVRPVVSLTEALVVNRSYTFTIYTYVHRDEEKATEQKHKV